MNYKSNTLIALTISLLGSQTLAFEAPRRAYHQTFFAFGSGNLRKMVGIKPGKAPVSRRKFVDAPKAQPVHFSRRKFVAVPKGQPVRISRRKFVAEHKAQPVKRSGIRTFNNAGKYTSSINFSNPNVAKQRVARKTGIRTFNHPQLALLRKKYAPKVYAPRVNLQPKQTHFAVGSNKLRKSLSGLKPVRKSGRKVIFG